MDISDDDTVTSCPVVAPINFPSSAGLLIDLTVGAASHTGLVRSTNQDHYAAVRRTRSRQILCTNVETSGMELLPQHAYVLVVADGVGGRESGKLASELVLRIGWDLGSRDLSWIMKFEESQWPRIREQFEAYAREIQNAMRQLVRANPQYATMATTWTCVCLLDSEAVIAHVGDSRAYLFRGGVVRQLTRDQTLAQEMQDRGLPAEDAARYKNSLINAFTAEDEDVFVDVDHVSLASGDRLLLCTDGLTKMASDDEIGSTLAAAPTAQSACDSLVELALRHGGTDNITALVAEFQSSPAQGASG
ncbi:MAG TPA: protein phosphatase 2C domain-containing protein [Planctomycetaceae bacterium]|jgi:protein phosphatase